MAMVKTVISTDSPADLDESLCEKYGVTTVPLHIILDDKSYQDGVNITPLDIYKFYDKNKSLPKTSAVSIHEYHQMFEALSKNGNEIVHLSLSSEISATFHNASLAAKAFKNVFVVDTKSLSSGMALLVIKAAEMAKAGKNGEDIAEKIRELRKKTAASFILDKLEFLKEGGRCSALTAFGANVLNIKPSIKMNNGKLSVAKKYRGSVQMSRIKYINDLIDEYGDRIDTSRVIFDRTYDVADSEIDQIKKAVLHKIKFDEVIDAKAGCTISSHCGKNTFGLMFMLK